MAKLEIEDSVYAALTSEYTDKSELKLICSMQLAKLISGRRKGRPRKHTTLVITMKQEAFLAHYCLKTHKRRNDVLQEILSDASEYDLEGKIDRGMAGPSPTLVTRGKEDSGDRSISFSPTTDIFNHWGKLSHSVNASKALVMHTLLDQFILRQQYGGNGESGFDSPKVSDLAD